MVQHMFLWEWRLVVLLCPLICCQIVSGWQESYIFPALCDCRTDLDLSLSDVFHVPRTPTDVLFAIKQKRGEQNPIISFWVLSTNHPRWHHKLHRPMRWSFHFDKYTAVKGDIKTPHYPHPSRYGGNKLLYLIMDFEMLMFLLSRPLQCDINKFIPALTSRQPALPSPFFTFDYSFFKQFTISHSFSLSKIKNKVSCGVRMFISPSKIHPD